MPSANCIFDKFVENRMKTTALGGSIHIIYINSELNTTDWAMVYLYHLCTDLDLRECSHSLRTSHHFSRYFFHWSSNLTLCSYRSSSWLLRKKSRLKVALDFFESGYYSGRFLHEDCCFLCYSISFNSSRVLYCIISSYPEDCRMKTAYYSIYLKTDAWIAELFRGNDITYSSHLDFKNYSCLR